jgi:hypothetical protein
MAHASHHPVQSAFGVFVSVFVGLTVVTIILAAFRIEEHAFSILLGGIGATPIIPGLGYTLAQGLAAGLCGAKLVLPFVIVQQVAARGGWALRVNALRALVIGLALLMTLVIVGNATISPNTQTVIDARIAEIDAKIATARDTRGADLDATAEKITDRTAAEIATVTKAADERLKELNTLLDAERQIGGSAFKGPRYIELEGLIAEQVAERDRRIATLRATEAVELNRIATDRVNAEAIFTEQREADIAAIDRLAIAASPEAQHPAIMTSLAIVKKFAPPQFADPVLVTVALSVLISLVFELLPMTLLGHVYRTFTVARGVGQVVGLEGTLTRSEAIRATKAVPTRFRSNRNGLQVVETNKENPSNQARSAPTTDAAQPPDAA